MWKSSRVVLAGLLAIILLAAGGAGCGGQILSGRVASEELDPFITDRVVTVRLVMNEEDWGALQANATAEQYFPADFWFDSELVPDVAVRAKGYSSLWFVASMGTPRLSFKVDFNLLNRGRTFRGLKKLNLNNGFTDPTLIRECLAYELFEQMGIPTPRASFVDLWVNDTHLGLYTQVEQVDQTFLKRHFPDDFDGNLYKPEMPAAYLNWTEADLEEQRARLPATEEDDSDGAPDINIGGGKLSEILRALQQGESNEPWIPQPETPPPQMPPGLIQPPGMRPPGMPPGMQPPGTQPPGQPGDLITAMGLKTNENDPDHTALFRFLDILNNEPEETFPEKIEEVLDVDEVLRFLAVSTVTVHLDNYLGIGHNYYLYEIDGKFIIIPWDLNMAFGTFNCGVNREGLINFYIDEPTCGPLNERPLVERLLSHQPYLDTYHEYVESLLEGPFEVDKMLSRIDELADLVRPFVEADELKFFPTILFERGLTEDVTGFRMPALGLKTFMVERSASVRQQLNGERPSAGDGSGNGWTWQL